MDRAPDLRTLLERCVIVLVEPWEPGNVGSICRGMNHFGCRDLRIVAADEAQHTRLRQGDARRFATHALNVLQEARFFTELDPALEGSRATFAFTAREGRLRTPRHDLIEASCRMVERLQEGPIALMFGTEEKGLSRDHLTRATDIVQIPLPGPHDVLNLSQAVLLALWELARAAGSLEQSPRSVRPPGLRATAEERRGLECEWDHALTAMGYGRKGPGTLHERVLRRFMEMFDRAGHERDDASMMRGVTKRVFRITDDPMPEE